MTLAAGTPLGSYEVLVPIGAGGMGEVYQAHDTKLGRDVAIKVLPQAFAHDSERLSRFQREAKMLAALNHPNIATIHGLEQSNGTRYLVMELVPGETLAERIKRDGALPVEEALTIGKHIAEALEAAHEKAIIHRDLKPANVKLTPEGKIKVLDFGLAKAFAADTTDSNPSHSPTLSAAATMQGVILGTAAYMSPEQARGKAVDKRTDIWAFGCVLYELLTGKQAFQGETVTEILAAVLRAEPGWEALPAATPPSICTLLQRCLQKDASRRARDAGDVKIEIEEALAAPTLGPTPNAAPKAWRQWLPWALALLCAFTALVLWTLKITSSPVTRAVSRFTITLPPDQRLAGWDQPMLALSPDGSKLVYAATQGGIQQLYLRAFDGFESIPVPGTEGGTSPFFSPDGNWLGFFADAKMKKIAVTGGAVLTLADAISSRGASWGGEGSIVFTPVGVSSVQQLSEGGGALQRLTVLQKGETAHRWPHILPDGKAILFTGGSMTEPVIAVHSLASGERRNLIPGGTSPRYAASGHLIYAQAGNLMAVPFDLQRLATTGPAIPIVDGVSQSATTLAAQYSLSSGGTLVYVLAGTQGPQRKMVMVSRNGVEQTLDAPTRTYGVPVARLSPDNRQVAVGTDGQTWAYDLSRKTFSRITFEGSQNGYPVWTPDGKRIAFQSNKEGPLNVFWQSADGSGGAERLSTSEFPQYPTSFSPDGEFLAYVEINPTTGYDIWVLRLRDRKAQPFIQTRFLEGSPSFSPDGHWLAYMSDESGRPEIYVQSFPVPGGKRQVSTEGGIEPMWNRNGRKLFYRIGDKMMGVEIATQPTLAAGTPKVLFRGRYQPTPGTLANYDVSSDGQRFLMMKEGEEAKQINVVLNWFEELKQKVPPGAKK